MKNQKGLAPVVIILIIVGVLAIGTGAWYYFNFRVYNPMVLEPTIWCDIDGDKDCDTDDAQLITNNLGECAESPKFNELADVDHNGCVTLDDRDRLFSEINKIENWKTYRNEEYGFEVKYPKDWNFEMGKVSKGIIIQPNEPRIPGNRFYYIAIIGIDKIDKNEPSNHLFQGVIDNFIGAEKLIINGNQFFRRRTDCFNGERGIEYVNANIDETRLILFTLAYNSGSPSRCLRNEEISLELKIFDQILSTFKFIE